MDDIAKQIGLCGKRVDDLCKLKDGHERLGQIPEANKEDTDLDEVSKLQFAG